MRANPGEMFTVLPICRWSELEGKVLAGVVLVLVGPVRIDPEVPSSEAGGQAGVDGYHSVRYYRF